MRLSDSVSPPRGWKLFLLLAAVLCVSAALAFLIGPDTVEGSRRVIRITARLSFLLFLAAFSASALAALYPGRFTHALLRERRTVGLGFAFSHLLHAIGIHAFSQLNPAFWPARSALANAPGSLGYLFIVLLAITSYRPLARYLGGATWRRLHLMGMWVIAAVFAYSYLKRVPVNLWYTLPSALLCAAIAVRLIGKRARRIRRAQASAPRRSLVSQV